MQTLSLFRIGQQTLPLSLRRDSDEISLSSSSFFLISPNYSSMAATGLSFRCENCGAPRKSVEEAQQHAELTAHTNFFESTEETDLHTKSIGYAKFVHRTKEAAKPIDLEAAKKSEAEGWDGGEEVNM